MRYLTVRRSTAVAAFALLVLSGSACKSCADGTGGEGPRAAPASTSSVAPVVTPPPAEKPRELDASLGDLRWAPPQHWTAVGTPSGAMLASYRTPRTDSGEGVAEFVVFRVNSTAPALIASWEKQFAGAKATVAERDVNGLHYVFVTLEGAYTVPGMAKPITTSGHALVAAIVTSVSPLHYFRLEGPHDTVMAARPTLDALVESVHR